MTVRSSRAIVRPTHAPPGYAGLLTQLMTNTLDADYETVAESRAERPSGTASGPRRRVALFAAVVAFGGLLGVSALRTEQNAPQTAAERAELIDRIHAGQDTLDSLHADIASLQAAVTSLQQGLADDVSDDEALSAQLTELGTSAGTIGVTGPGVQITADDADPSEGPGGVILDVDLQAMVNGLWEAGAEAIAIDGHRLTALTSIRFAGEAITVDYRSLSPPYIVDAVGDPDTLAARFLDTEGGQTWLGLRANFGISFEMADEDKVVVPADPHDHLLYARASQAPEGTP
jgi:uncharacterized protein YlxW (UPF0749 family)